MSEFKEELTSLINKHSVENHSNTPDFILVQFLLACLGGFNQAMSRRDDWYDKKQEDSKCSTADG